jgi:hypothetical protein
MRAVVRQLCRVCGLTTSSKAEMDEHINEKHGNNWAPAMLTRAKDQQEFKPCLSKTRWGSDLR